MRVNKLMKKRLITGLAAVFAVVAIYQYTNMTVDKKLNPVTGYFAKTDIPPHTKITKNMIFERVISASAIPPNSYTKINDIVGSWTVDGYGIPKNSLFYKGKIKKTDEMPDSAILNLKDNEYAFPLLVDLETSSGNAILPNSYVDLFFVTDKTDDKRPLSGPLFDRVRVTSVKDSQTRNVFDASKNTDTTNNNQQVATSTSNPNTVAKLYTLAVSKADLEVLNQAKLLGNIIPVASGKSYSEEQENKKGDKNITVLDDNQQIINWIKNSSYSLDGSSSNDKNVAAANVTQNTNNISQENTGITTTN